MPIKGRNSQIIKNKDPTIIYRKYILNIITQVESRRMEICIHWLYKYPPLGVRSSLKRESSLISKS